MAMRRLIVAVATVLLVAGVTIAQNETSPGMSPDETQQMLKDRSHEPDLSDENASSATRSDEAGMRTTHSESSSSSSSVTFGVTPSPTDQSGSSDYGSGNAAARAAMASMIGRHHGATAQAGVGGTSCSAPAVGKCAACSIACPAGQAAQCRAGDMGIMTMACPTASKCTCKG